MGVQILTRRWLWLPLAWGMMVVWSGCAGSSGGAPRAPHRPTAVTPSAPATAKSAPRAPTAPAPAPAASAARPTPPAQASVPGPSSGVLLGIDVLERQGFAPLLGKRVGLLTHPAGVNRLGVSTIDVLRRDRRVRLVALFGPEHGIYGNEKADVPVPDKVDARTGLPVYSLYGPYRKPTPAMLRGIDVLVIDLQDVGARSYTYVSCMRYAMEACFANNVEVVVPDRPNPLGGQKVSGPRLEPGWMSYVGAFTVPYVHGLTIGELARYAAAEPGVLKVSDAVRRRGRLTIVGMQGWQRRMLWPQTGLRWVPTSPYIPTFDAAVGYAMTGLGAQIGGFRHGIGSPYPFRLLSHPAIPQSALIAELNRRALPGLRFAPQTVPGAGPGGAALAGVRVEISDWNAWRPTELSFHLMQLAAAKSPRNPFAAATRNEADLFNKHVGSTAWWEALVRDGARVDVRRQVAIWESQAAEFQRGTRKYWLYP